MRNLIIKFSILVFVLAGVVSCDEDVVIYDVENGESFATFQNENPDALTFNPVEDTRNVYTVSVSTVSTMDRAVSVSVDSSSTVDPSFYTIETLNPVIPAGEYSTEVVITTPASEVFPATGSTLVLNLESVEGAEIKSFSTDTFTIPFSVKCPSVDLSAVTGEGNVVTNELSTDAFGVSIADGGATRTVLAGPGENQITIVDGIGTPLGSEDLVLNVNPTSGNVSYGGPEDAIFFFNGPDPISYSSVSGKVLTCIGQINLEIAAPFGAPFNSNTFKIQF